MAAADRRVGQALGLLKGLRAAKGIEELGGRTRIVVSPLWAGAGGSAVFNRVNLPNWALDAPRWHLAAILAHELVHVRQGIRFFGSIDTEREAFVVQRKVEIELLKRERPQPAADIARRQEDIRVLESGFAEARAWIIRQGPMYTWFPDRQPRWWQVTRWWPQVWQALKFAIGGRRSGGGAA